MMRAESQQQAPAAATPPLARLTLRDPEGGPLVFDAASLALVGAEATLGCRLTLQLDLASYQLIDRRGLFNTRPDLRTTQRGGRFKSPTPIVLVADLRPDLLERLLPLGADPAALGGYLERRIIEAPGDLLLDSESWFARSVEQASRQGPRGYRTIWHYLDLSEATLEQLGRGDIVAPLMAFMRERDDLDLSTVDAQLSGELSLLIERGLREALGELLEPPAPGQALSAATLRFFADEGWEVHHDEAQAMIHAAFQGEHGRLSCYAQISEADQQLAFYTLGQQRVPAARMAAMAELIARLNYGLVLGGFELDFADGQLRYKTSIDVEGDRLSSALVRRLVYSNVLTIDYYMPAIEALISRALTPLQALALVEGP